MNSRQSYFLISVISILSIFIGIFIWSNKNPKLITNFNEDSFNPPYSSKYIPKNSDLISHWKLNPNELTKYIENHQDRINKNTINKKINLIRDSSFKLISLDFGKDISRWVGDYGSFALLNSNKQPLKDWIMVLGIKEDVNIEEELKSISDQEIIDKKIKSSDSKIAIFSKKISQNKSIYSTRQL